ncbi:MAG: peptide ABC transporter substrate-binding protein [bacterium]|nr:peptide ABC transporter substrate-binding protein [bacterium]
MDAPRWLRTGLSLALLAGVFAAVLALAGRARLERADFVFNNGSEPQTLDPAAVTGVPEGRVVRSIFEGLIVQHPETLAPLPGMAESWTISDDGLVYTFRIREGAKWTNGDAITAHDFTYSFERLLHPETAAEYSYQLWYAKGAKAYSTELDDDGEPIPDFDTTVGIRATDELTLEIELEAPTPFFLDLVAFYSLYPVNRRNIEEARERWPDDWRIEWVRPENIVTNGPYKIAYRRVNDRIRLEKNEGYWDADNVAFETIDILAVEQYTTMLNMYLTGEAHWIDRVATNVVPRMIVREDFDPTPYLGSYFYRVNVTREPMNDARVRRALSLTIPRKAICEKIMKAGQLPAYGVVPPGIPGYAGIPAGKEDPELARALLAEAGYGPGGKPFPTIEIHYNTAEAHRDIALAVADVWQRELGVNAKLLNQEWKVYLDTQTNILYDVSRSSWIGDYGDPNTFLDLWVTGGDNNRTGWGDPRYDQLIADAARELDYEKRMELMLAAETLAMEELPVLPVYYYTTQNVVSPRLGGWFNNTQDVHFPKFWYWMDDAELATKRAAQQAASIEGNATEIIEASGPSAGLYSPAARLERGE